MLTKDDRAELSGYGLRKEPSKVKVEADDSFSSWCKLEIMSTIQSLRTDSL